MGLLDSEAFADMDPELRRIYMQSLGGQQTDKREPLNMGLMAAGLGMLANATKGAAGGIGAGGLLGLQAYTDAQQRQQKDPMQQINMLNALQGLNSNMQGAKWMRQFQAGQQNANAYATPQAPTSQMGPPTDQAPDFMGAPAAQPVPPPQQPQQPGQYMPPVSQLIAGAGLPGAAGQVAKMLYEQTMKDPTKLSPGDTPTWRDPFTGELKQGEQIPDLEKNMYRGPDGIVRAYTGATKAVADLENAKAQATAAANAQYAPVQTTRGGLPVTTTAAQLAAAVNRPAGAIPQDMQDLIDATVAQYQKNPGQPVKFAYTPTPQAQLGVGRLPEDAAAAQANALLAPDQKKALADQFTQKDTAMLSKAQDAALTASQGNDMLNSIKGKIASQPGIYNGMFANGTMGVAAFFNGLGVPFDQARFSNSQESKKYMDELGLSLIKGYVGATNISDADRNAVMSVMPRITDDPKARGELIGTLQGINDKKVDLFQRMDSHLRDNGSLKGFDYGMTRSDQGGAPPAARGASAQQQAAPANLSENMTAIAKAQQAIKAGADPQAVRQRLMQSGYSARGL